MEFIFIGQNVKLLRTDGRVQWGVVAKINGFDKTVEVQWYECGETRGKHVDLAALLKWNPEIMNKDLTYYIPKGEMGVEINSRTQNGRKLNRKTISGYTAQNVISTGECTKNEANAHGLLNKAIIVPSTATETAEMIKEFKKSIEFKPLFNGQTYVDDNQPIIVCVRKMPLSLSEIECNDIDVISVPQYDTLIVHGPKIKIDLTTYLENHKFRFDYVFDHRCDNAMVYEYTAKPLIKTIFDGGMATCFAYGATGTGKTQTMEGEFIRTNQNYNKVMAANDILNCLKDPQYKALNLFMSVSSFEIYEEEVFDLLANKQKLRVLENDKQQVQIDGLTLVVIDSVKKVIQLIQQSCNARTSAASGVRTNVARNRNQISSKFNSSCSHAVFQIVLRSPGSTKVYGKFSFIDLAGTLSADIISLDNIQPVMEDAKINISLLRLRDCMRAQGNKLSQVLRESFIGVKSKICLIAIISSGLSSFVDTLKVMRYIDWVKQLPIKNNPEVLKKENPIKVEHSTMECNKNGEVTEIGQYREITLSYSRVWKLSNYVESDREQIVDLTAGRRDMMADFYAKSNKEEIFSSTIKPSGKK